MLSPYSCIVQSLDSSVTRSCNLGQRLSCLHDLEPNRFTFKYQTQAQNIGVVVDDFGQSPFGTEYSRFSTDMAGIQLSNRPRYVMVLRSTHYALLLKCPIQPGVRYVQHVQQLKHLQQFI